MTTVASPYSTIPVSTASSCIQELQEYVTAVSQVNKSHNNEQPNNTVEDQLLLDESHILESDTIHSFTPSQGHGVALYFTLIQEKGLVQTCAAAVLLGETNTNKKTAIDNAVGIIVVVAVSGLPFAHSSSVLVHTLSRRILDFKSALPGLESFSEHVQTCLSSLLSTLLLFDDEELKTNTMVDTEQVVFLSDASTEGSPLEKMKSPIGAVRKNVKSTRWQQTSIFHQGRFHI